jgi:hypothetical protein
MAWYRFLAKETVRVTEKDIEQGQPYCPFLCPVSRALTRRGYENVATDEYVVFVTCPKDRKRYGVQLPPRATSFIQLFDNQEDVKLFQFTLNLEGTDHGEI